MSMYQTACSYCGKKMWTHAEDKLGTLPVVYCSPACEAAVKYERRFIDSKRFG